MKKSIRSSKKVKGACSPMRTNPALWERVKTIVKKSPKGGKPNTWSARKAQLAVAMYKKKGGGYRGAKKSCNSLTKWSKEDWGYINADSDLKKGKSKNKSKNKSPYGRYRRETQSPYGRYLPRKVREQLTPRERQLENRLKGRKRGVHVPYSKSVLKKLNKVVNK